MDRTDKIAIIGQPGCGKSTLMTTLGARIARAVFWDQEGEYAGPLVTRAELPALFTRRAFRAVYRPTATYPEQLPREFEALVHVVMELGRDLTLCVDEAANVIPSGDKTGGLGRLLLQGRKRGISVVWASQFLTRLPTPLLGTTRLLYLFRVDGRGDQQVLRSYLSEAQVAQVAALPDHEYLTVHK